MQVQKPSGVNEIAVSKHYAFRQGKDNVLIRKTDESEYDPKNIETKISVYQDRITGWFFDIGDKLTFDGDANFVILKIAIDYIEGNQQLREGVGSIGGSKAIFVRGIMRMFHLTAASKPHAEKFYELVRCGLSHDGMPRIGVYISDSYPLAVEVRINADTGVVGALLINPHRLLEEVKKDLAVYVAELRKVQNTTLRQNFENMFKI